MYELYSEIIQKIGLPEVVASVTWPVIPFVCVAVLLIAVVLYLVLMERRVLAWLTVRKGPNRVGPNGVLQTVADAIKLLCKEDIMSKDTNKLLFTLAPVIVFVPTMLIYCLIPFTEKFLAVNISAGLFLIFALSSITTVGLVMAGWSSNNKYSLLGGMRAAAQAISYEVPLALAVIAIAVLAQSLSLLDIVSSQTGGLLNLPVLDWNVFSWNLWPSIIGFGVFFICSIAEVNRIPFDLPEAESELVSGYNTEYSGMKFALFFLGEYSALFIMSVLTITLYFGGYTSPFSDYVSVLLFKNILNNPYLLNIFVHFEQAFWLVVKTYALIFLIIWIRATLPRLRADQLMSFAWKFLLPLSLLNLFIVACLKFFWVS